MSSEAVHSDAVHTSLLWVQNPDRYRHVTRSMMRVAYLQANCARLHEPRTRTSSSKKRLAIGYAP
jgi:hypothetical protein